jgi:hypothetical protein
MILVFPMIHVEVLFEKSSVWTHYGWVIGVMIVGTIIEFYLIFYISLQSVHKVSELIHLE